MGSDDNDVKKTVRMKYVELKDGRGRDVTEVILDAYREAEGSYERAGEIIEISGRTIREWVKKFELADEIEKIREELSEKGIRRQGRRYDKE